MAGAHEQGAASATANSEAERLSRQRKRSIAIALGLGFLVLLFYAATIVKMRGDGPAKRPAMQTGAAAGKAVKQ